MLFKIKSQCFFRQKIGKIERTCLNEKKQAGVLKIVSKSVKRIIFSNEGVFDILSVFQKGRIYLGRGDFMLENFVRDLPMWKIAFFCLGSIGFIAIIWQTCILAKGLKKRNQQMLLVLDYLRDLLNKECENNKKEKAVKEEKLQTVLKKEWEKQSDEEVLEEVIGEFLT